MLVRKAYKFRLYPNQAQQELLVVQFGHTRFVYNYMLGLRKERYQETGEGLSYQDMTALLTELKRDPEHQWLREADSQVLQQSLKDLDRAYKNFFAGRGRYPRFRSRRGKQAIRYPQRVRADVAAGRSYLRAQLPAEDRLGQNHLSPPAGRAGQECDRIENQEQSLLCLLPGRSRDA